MYDKQIECIQDDGLVRFAEGSSVAADTILYCTGYDSDVKMVFYLCSFCVVHLALLKQQ
jgi:hypothetical protein